jgi:hypothetical protein
LNAKPYVVSEKKNVIGKYRKNLKHFIENTPKIAPNPYFVIMDPSMLSLKKEERKNTSSLKYMKTLQ